MMLQIGNWTDKSAMARNTLRETEKTSERGKLMLGLQPQESVE